MNLIILEKRDRTDSCLADNEYDISGERAEHIQAVLRAKVGDVIRIGLLNGPQGCGVITRMSPGKVMVCATWEEELPLDEPAIDIICALPRPQTLKKVLQSCATMGVRNLYLVRANRVEKSYFHSPLLEESNLRRFLIEGLSQGRRTIMPQVFIHKYFKKFFQDELPGILSGNSEVCLKLLPDLGSEQRIADILTSRPTGQILVAIGPEGGWVPFEEDLMEAIGFERYCLGPWTLRVENAVVAAISQLSATRY
ncbi:MAG: 16S rRNA (uracil(1498)-N(3))-methyltransferase [Phycisphaerae bacterium]|nr:16S rRNA (uracil(1498)-N(3))-methyltransferase [Phycisphaerae bacterium]